MEFRNNNDKINNVLKEKLESIFSQYQYIFESTSPGRKRKHKRYYSIDNEKQKLQIEILCSLESNPDNNKELKLSDDSLLILAQCFFSKHKRSSLISKNKFESEDFQEKSKSFFSQAEIDGDFIRKNQGIFYLKLKSMSVFETEWNQIEDWFDVAIKKLLSYLEFVKNY